MDIAREENKRRLVVPHLHRFYVAVGDFWYPLLRVTAGLLMLPHGWPKLMAGPEAIAARFENSGYVLSFPLACLVIFIETVGGACIALGLFTRFFAAAAAIQMAYITFVAHAPQGWSRMEYPLLWGVVFLAIALHGGGPYSVDRKLGREL